MKMLFRRVMSGEEQIEQNAKGIDVCGDGDGLVLELLGSGELRRERAGNELRQLAV